MSRSRRRTPIIGNATCESEKADKRICNRKMRRNNKRILETIEEDEDEIFMEKDEAMNPAAMGKDGKQWWPEDDRRK